MLSFYLLQPTLGHSLSSGPVKWQRMQDPTDDSSSVTFAEDDEVDLTDCVDRLSEDMPEANGPFLSGKNRKIMH